MNILINCLPTSYILCTFTLLFTYNVGIKYNLTKNEYFNNICVTDFIQHLWTCYARTVGILFCEFSDRTVDSLYFLSDKSIFLPRSPRTLINNTSTPSSTFLSQLPLNKWTNLHENTSCLILYITRIVYSLRNFVHLMFEIRRKLVSTTVFENCVKSERRPRLQLHRNYLIYLLKIKTERN